MSFAQSCYETKTQITDSFKMKKNRQIHQKNSSEVFPPRTLSPVRNTSSKHQVTPLKTKSKTSKCETGADVHTVCSSPVTPRSRLSNSHFSSPSTSSLPCAYYHGSCSQDLPEVIWDYTSPKQRKGARRIERPVTIEDLLKNLRRAGVVPDCNPQSSSHIIWLEKWMASQNTYNIHVAKEHQGVKKKENKKNSSRLIEEMTQLLESISNRDNTTENKTQGNRRASIHKPNEDKSEENSSCVETLNQQEFSAKNSCILLDEKIDSDSYEELWGDASDDSLILKATQEIESGLINVCHPSNEKQPEATNGKCAFVSVIPKTLTNRDAITENQNANISIKKVNDLNLGDSSKAKDIKMQPIHSTSVLVTHMESSSSCSKVAFDKKEHLHSTSELEDNDWDPEFEDNDWDPEFEENDWDPEFGENGWGDSSLDAETLSSIPDNVLLGGSLAEHSTYNSELVDEDIPNMPHSNRQISSIPNNNNLRVGGLENHLPGNTLSPNLQIGSFNSQNSTMTSINTNLCTWQSQPDVQGLVHAEVYVPCTNVPLQCDTDDDENKDSCSNTLLLQDSKPDSLDDEFIHFQPEVWSWMDDIESQSSESPKCTPEEIALKKDEALKRLKKNKIKRKTGKKSQFK